MGSAYGETMSLKNEGMTGFKIVCLCTPNKVIFFNINMNDKRKLCTRWIALGGDVKEIGVRGN